MKRRHCNLNTDISNGIFQHAVLSRQHFPCGFPCCIACSKSTATPSACYRGPKPQKCPKWLGEGAKGVLDPRSKGLPRVFCTTKTLFCTGATLFRTSARGLWRPWPKGPFALFPNHFCFPGPLRAPLPGPLGHNSNSTET